MTLLYILIAIVLLGILIAIHEFGHFIAARITGIAVKEYSIGFGPNIVQWKSKKHDTLFSIRPIPLGGYCMFYGDETDQENVDDPRAFAKAKVWKRFLTVFSGPFMNFVLAFLVAIGLMASYGYSTDSVQPYIYSVDTQSPAQEAGFLQGDEMVAVNGIDIGVGEITKLSEVIASLEKGESVTVTVVRNGEEIDLTVTPQWSEEEQRSLIGIAISSAAPLTIGQIVPAAWNSCIDASTAILDSLGKLVTTGEGASDASGPVGVVQIVAEQTQQGGLRIFLTLSIIISINLGLVNLLPIPGLDGSRLVFMIVEAIRRKPINQKIEATVHLAGYVLLFGLMIFFTFRDVVRIFQ